MENPPAAARVSKSLTDRVNRVICEQDKVRRKMLMARLLIEIAGTSESPETDPADLLDIAHGLLEG